MLVHSFLYALILPLCAVCQSVCMAVIYNFLRLTLVLYYLYLPLTRTHLSHVWQEQIEQRALQQEQSQTVDQVRATKPGLLLRCVQLLAQRVNKLCDCLLLMLQFDFQLLCAA